MMSTSKTTKPTTVKSLVRKVQAYKAGKKGRNFIKAALERAEAGSVATLSAKLKNMKGEDRTTVKWLLA